MAPPFSPHPEEGITPQPQAGDIGSAHDAARIEHRNGPSRRAPGETGNRSSSRSNERAIVLIDGSNWHHGLETIGVRSSSLDHRRVAEKLVRGRELREIRFYIGAVGEDLSRIREQRRFLDSLRDQGVAVCLGRIQRLPMSPLAREERRRLRNAFAGREQEVPPDLLETLRAYWTSAPSEYREKGVDTRITGDLVDLAHRDEYDAAYLLSADSDFVPAVEIVHRLGKIVFVANPRPGNDLTKVVHRYLKVSRGWFDGLYL